MSNERDAAIVDRSLRTLVEATERSYTGSAAGVEVVVNGARSVLSVEVAGAQSSAAVVGTELTRALNEAVERAEEAIVAVLRADPALAPQLGGLLEGEPLPDDRGLSGDALSRDFEGHAADGLVVAHVSGKTRRFTSIYVDAVTPEIVAQIPTAANRAMAAAEVGREGATPLDEEIDGVLARLDAKLSSISEQLDDVDADLDSILRTLG